MGRWGDEAERETVRDREVVGARRGKIALTADP